MFLNVLWLILCSKKHKLALVWYCEKPPIGIASLCQKNFSINIFYSVCRLGSLDFFLDFEPIRSDSLNHDCVSCIQSLTFWWPQYSITLKHENPTSHPFPKIYPRDRCVKNSIFNIILHKKVNTNFHPSFHAHAEPQGMLVRNTKIRESTQ